ncbi:MAG: hypothetical protein Q9218_004816 [Villophora microphyllina]
MHLEGVAQTAMGMGNAAMTVPASMERPKPAVYMDGRAITVPNAVKAAARPKAQTVAVTVRIATPDSSAVGTTNVHQMEESVVLTAPSARVGKSASSLTANRPAAKTSAAKKKPIATADTTLAEIAGAGEAGVATLQYL